MTEELFSAELEIGSTASLNHCKNIILKLDEMPLDFDFMKRTLAFYLDLRYVGDYYEKTRKEENSMATVHRNVILCTDWCRLWDYNDSVHKAELRCRKATYRKNNVPCWLIPRNVHCHISTSYYPRSRPPCFWATFGI